MSDNATEIETLREEIRLLEEMVDGLTRVEEIQSNRADAAEEAAIVWKRRAEHLSGLIRTHEASVRVAQRALATERRTSDMRQGTADLQKARADMAVKRADDAWAVADAIAADVARLGAENAKLKGEWN